MKFPLVLALLFNALILSQAVISFHWPDVDCDDDPDCALIEDPQASAPGTATCSGGVCVCQDDNWEIYSEIEDGDKKCYRGIGATCDNDNQCTTIANSGGLGSDAGCVGDICSCDSGFTGYDGAWCLIAPTRNNDYACEIESQCTSLLATGLSCEGTAPNKECRCETSTDVLHLIDQESSSYECGAALNSNCDAGDECFTTAECKDEKCVCEPHYVPIVGDLDCGRMASFENEFACVEDEQCKTVANHANPAVPPNCVSQKCGCAAGHEIQVVSENRFACAERVTCDNDDDCMEHASCVNEIVAEDEAEKRCQCENGLVDGGECINYATLNNLYMCTENSAQCTLIEDSSSATGFATCDTYYQQCYCSGAGYAFVYPFEDHEYACTEPLGSYCENNDDCMIDNSRCEDHKCVCAAEHDIISYHWCYGKASSSMIASVLSVIGACIVGKLLK